MLDIKFIRDNPDLVKDAVKNKLVDVDVDQLLIFDSQRRELQSKLDEINRQRNALADANKKTKPSSDTIELGKKLKEKHNDIEKELNIVEQEYTDLLYRVPNIPSDDTPIGETEKSNKIIKTYGEIPKFDFKPKEHWEMGEALDVIDNDLASNIAGARFAYIKGDLVLLEMALIQYAMSILTNQQKLKIVIDKAELDVETKPFVPIL